MNLGAMVTLKDLDKLLELAKQEAKPEKLSQMERFILDFEIVRSDEKALGQNIFWVYKKWCKTNKDPAVSRNTFFKHFQRYFAYYRDSGVIYYRVTNKHFQLSREEWLHMRNDFNEERQKNKKAKKRNQKPQP